jgi:hypothetical protein
MNMTLALAIARILIPLIPSIEGDIVSLVSWISNVRAAAKQTGEWTDVDDQKFRAAVIAAGQADPAYK